MSSSCMERSQFSADQVNEFAEYASLVRSIRVENTTQLSRRLLSTPGDDGTETDEEPRRRSKSVKSNGDDDGESEKSYDSDCSDGPKGSTFDARWPLGPDEVTVPKWHLRDEILGFARATAPRNPSPECRPRRAAGKARERVENDILQPVPDMVKDLLVFVVNLMAVHIPPTTDNLQNRLQPMSWEHVINVLSGSLHGREQGPLTKDMIRDARTRLEELYGPPKADLRFLDLPVEPDPRGYAQRIAFPGGMPERMPAFTDDGVLAVPEPLADLRRKRKAFLETVGELEAKRKRRRPTEDVESLYAASRSSATTPFTASDEDEIDELEESD